MKHQSAHATDRLRDLVAGLEHSSSGGLTLLQLARALLQVDAPAQDCSEWQAALPEYIEAELNRRPDPRHRVIRQHLDFCQDCLATYLDLLEVAMLAERDEFASKALNLNIDFSFLDQCSGRMSPDA